MMRYPEALLLPVLMLADYLLTILGAIRREGKYGEHFKAEHYELNPVFRNTVAQKKWFSPKHTVLTVLFSGGLVGLLEFGGLPEGFVEALLGCLFVVYGMILGRHVSNLLIFRYVANNPGEISGQVVLAHAMLLAISTCQYIVVAVPMLFLAIFSPTPFVVGGGAGVMLLVSSHLIWRIRYLKKDKKQA